MSSYAEELEEFYQKAKRAVNQSDVRIVQCCGNCELFNGSDECHGQDELILPVKSFYICKRWKEMKNEKE